MNEKRVHIVQLLCPQRHAVLGMAYENDATTDDEAVAALTTVFETLVSAGKLKPECGLCHATELFYERAPTRFKTMKEATPELVMLELANLETARRLKERRN